DSNSSNEKQDNNKNNVISDNKFIQPHSITYFGNQKDTANDEITLYNDYTNKNDFDTFKSFNNDSEKTNRKATIVKSSFIQNFIAPSFDSSLYNKIDIIYGTSYANENLETFYVNLGVANELQNLLSTNFYYTSKNAIESTRGKLRQLDGNISKTIKDCEHIKKKLINAMLNFQNPLYEFYKNRTH
ncbi:hypothetical protein PCHDK_000545200, partial [Plasmodium chabaudi adami]